MVTEPFDSARALAQSTQRARQARSWTLDQLAARAGISRRVLVQIEQGQGNPTITTLLAISDALGIGLPQLLQIPETPQLNVQSIREAPVMWRGSAGGSATLLAGTPPPTVVELWSWTLAPGERYTSGAHTDGTREMLTVQQGRVRLEVGERSVVLSPSDTATFVGTADHAYEWAPISDRATSRRRQAEPAQFTLVTVQPRVGTVTPQRPSENDT